MRTTLDIDDDVLAAAKDLAKAEGRTMGAIVSELARRGLTTPSVGGPTGFAEAQAAFETDTWPTFPVRVGLPVTSELIERIEDELDREDAEAYDHTADAPRTS